MNTKIVKIGDKEYTIKEISLDDSLELGTIKEPNEITKKLLELAIVPSLTIEQRKEISMRDGLLLIKEINELNRLTEDFISSLRTS